MRVPELLVEPWAIAGPAFDSIVESARTGGAFGDVKAKALGVVPEALARFMESAPESELEVRADGVAVIPVAGYLTRRPYWRGDRAAYEWIGQRVQEAVDRSDVRAIVLEVDSRGGQVNGTEELASLIREARGQMPVTAFVLGEASSAAYWIGSAASRVVVGRTSMVGSVGVLWTFVDWSKYDAEHGIEEITIVSSQSPDKDIDPTSADGRSRIQATVDQLAGVFVADVAANRGVSEDTVLSDFGRGWVLIGEEAVAAGMADRVGTFEDAIAEADSLETDFKARPAASRQEGTMELTIQQIIDSGLINAQSLREHFASAVSELTEPALSALRSDATRWHEAASAAAVAAECTRQREIAEAGKGANLPAVVAECQADPTITVEAAKAKLFEAQQARRQGQIDALAGDETDLDTPDNDDPESEAASFAESVKAAGDYAAKAGFLR